MLKAVELPAGVAHLGSGLADVDGDALAHVGGDEGDSVEFGEGGEGQDFARRPIKRKIHKGVEPGEKSGGAQAERQAGRLRQDDSHTNVRNRPLLLTYSK